MIWTSHCWCINGLVFVRLLVDIHWPVHGFPLHPLESAVELKTQRYIFKMHTWRGERLKVQCDARIAGFDVTKVKVVSALYLRRLSHSDCNPNDPVMTLVQLTYNNNSLHGGNSFHAVGASEDWTFHAEGMALNHDGTNALTAWVGITVAHARPEDSGLYKCDSEVQPTDMSGSTESVSNFVTVTVSPLKKDPSSTHVPVDKSLTAFYYDSSLIKPSENHKYADESVTITCFPRLLKRAPTLPFTVGEIHMLFLPLYHPSTDFITVASYFPDADQFYENAPPQRMWEINHVGTNKSISRDMDSLTLRIDISIHRLSRMDTGIFRCEVTDKSNTAVYIGEAGLKVSGVINALSGSCHPPRPGEHKSSSLEDDGIPSYLNQPLDTFPGKKSTFDLQTDSALSNDTNGNTSTVEDKDKKKEKEKSMKDDPEIGRAHV